MSRHGRLPGHRCERFWRRKLPCPFSSREEGDEEEDEAEEEDIAEGALPEFTKDIEARVLAPERVKALVQTVGIPEKVGSLINAVKKGGGGQLSLEQFTKEAMETIAIPNRPATPFDFSKLFDQSFPGEPPGPIPSPLGMGGLVDSHIAQGLQEASVLSNPLANIGGMEADAEFPGQTERGTGSIFNSFLGAGAAAASLAALAHARRIAQGLKLSEQVDRELRKSQRRQVERPGTRPTPSKVPVGGGRGRAPSGAGAGGFFFKAPTFKQGPSRQFSSEAAELIQAGLQ